MKQLSLFQGTPEEFQEPIIQSIKAEFKELKKHFQPIEPEEYLTRQQVADMLHIDLSSVHNWRKRGAITAVQIEGRILFRRSHIISKLVELKISKKC